jgi:hypothetical protein
MKQRLAHLQQPPIRRLKHRHVMADAHVLQQVLGALRQRVHQRPAHLPQGSQHGVHLRRLCSARLGRQCIPLTSSVERSAPPTGSVHPPVASITILVPRSCWVQRRYNTPAVSAVWPVLAVYIAYVVITYAFQPHTPPDACQPAVPPCHPAPTMAVIYKPRPQGNSTLERGARGCLHGNARPRAVRRPPRPSVVRCRVTWCRERPGRVLRRAGWGTSPLIAASVLTPCIARPAALASDARSNGRAAGLHAPPV